VAFTDEQKEVLKSAFRNASLVEAFTELVDSLYKKRYAKLHIKGPETKDELSGSCMALDELMNELKQLHKVALDEKPIST